MATPPESARRGAASASTADTSHIMLFDDDPVARPQLITQLGEDNAFACTVLSDWGRGKVAVRKYVMIHGCRPDIVLAVLRPPNYDALKLLQNLESIATADTMVLLLVDREGADPATMDTHLANSIRLGATGFLPYEMRSSDALRQRLMRISERFSKVSCMLHDINGEADRTVVATDSPLAKIQRKTRETKKKLVAPKTSADVVKTLGFAKRRNRRSLADFQEQSQTERLEAAHRFLARKADRVTKVAAEQTVCFIVVCVCMCVCVFVCYVLRVIPHLCTQCVQQLYVGIVW